MARRYCLLYLTCENDAEADRIADALLEQKLIVCAKKLPIAARYWWKGEKVDGDETMMMMESATDLLDEVEKKVKEIHSYETFVLEASEIIHVSKEAKEWMKDNLKPFKR